MPGFDGGCEGKYSRWEAKYNRGDTPEGRGESTTGGIVDGTRPQQWYLLGDGFTVPSHGRRKKTIR